MKREIIKEFGALMLGLLCAAGLSEAGLRLFSPQSLMTPAYDDRYGVRIFRANASIKHQTPWFHARYQVNEYGFRAAAYTLEKPAGVYRIATVGPSFTFGIGVNDAETYSAVLERKLNSLKDKKLSYQVLNCSWPGVPMNSFEFLFKELITGFDPDLVHVYVRLLGINYASSAKKDTLWGPDLNSTPFTIALRRAFRTLRYLPGYHWICENSHLWAFIRLRIASTVDTMAREKVQGDWKSVDDEKVQKIWNDTFDSLAQTVCAGRRGRVRLLATRDINEPPYPQIAAHLKKRARDPNSCIDYHEIDVPKQFIFADEGHWTPQGHEYVADEILSALRTRALP